MTYDAVPFIVSLGKSHTSFTGPFLHLYDGDNHSLTKEDYLYIYIPGIAFVVLYNIYIYVCVCVCVCVCTCTHPCVHIYNINNFIYCCFV